MDGDESNKHHAKDTSNQTSITDSNGHGEHSNTNVALQKVDNCLRISEIIKLLDMKIVQNLLTRLCGPSHGPLQSQRMGLL